MSAERSVISVGVFDGVHRGHVAILERGAQAARELGAAYGIVSFDPHPDVVLAKGPFHIRPPLTPLGEKRARLQGMGASWVEVLPFTREMAALSPEEFVERQLVPHGLLRLVVGADFALGRGRAGTVAALRAIGGAMGFEVSSVPLVEDDGRPISSTRIREALAGGRVEEAARLIGRRYSLTGMVVRGEGIGRTLGYPTANLRLHEEKWLPADGIYVVSVHHDGNERAGAMSIGSRPTFGGQVRTLEVHLLDFVGDLVGQDLTVEFVEWIRQELRFETPEALAVAMNEDVARVRERLAAMRGGA